MPVGTYWLLESVMKGKAPSFCFAAATAEMLESEGGRVMLGADMVGLGLEWSHRVLGD